MTADPSAPASPRLLDRVRERIRVKHYSIRTEQAYVDWIRRFILFHGKRHPQELGAPEVEAFLTHLAVAGRVAASTQNQAKSALLFLYREVLAVELPWLDGVTQARAPKRLPVVLTRDEVGGGAGAAGGDAVADREPALRLRATVDGVPAPAGEGCRLRPKRDSRARWQGSEGPGDDAADCAEVAAAGAFGEGAVVAPAGSWGRLRRGLSAECAGAQVSDGSTGCGRRGRRGRAAGAVARGRSGRCG